MLAVLKNCTLSDFEKKFSFLLPIGEKPPYFKGCSAFLRLFRALHVKPMRDGRRLTMPLPYQWNAQKTTKML